MNKNHKILISDLSRETELLESLDWDEELLEELYSYLDLHFSGNSIISPNLLLKEVEKLFGESCSKTLRDLIVEVSLTHGLMTNDPNVEH